MRRNRTKTRFYCCLVLSNVHKNALLQNEKKKPTIMPVVRSLWLRLLADFFEKTNYKWFRHLFSFNVSINQGLINIDLETSINL